jgi:hypothetical protein
MKILPSPTLPVLADLRMASTDQVAADGDFNARLRNEIHYVFGPAVQLRMTTLAPEAFDFSNGHSGNPDVR